MPSDYCRGRVPAAHERTDRPGHSGAYGCPLFAPGVVFQILNYHPDSAPDYTAAKETARACPGAFPAACSPAGLRMECRPAVLLWRKAQRGQTACRSFSLPGFCLFRPGRFRLGGPGASRSRHPARWTRFPPWPHLGSGMPRLRPVPRPRRIAFQGATHVFLHRKPPGFHIPANSPARQEDAAAAFHHVPRKLTGPKKDQPNATGHMRERLWQNPLHSQFRDLLRCPVPVKHVPGKIRDAAEVGDIVGSGGETGKSGLVLMTS